MADEGIEVVTGLPVAQIAGIFRDTLASTSRRVEFGSVRRDDSPFRQFDKEPDFSAWASAIGIINYFNNWAIQIYVFDEGDHRVVQLLTVGSSTMGRVLRGAKNTYSNRVGRQKIDLILQHLQSADPALQAAS